MSAIALMFAACCAYGAEPEASGVMGVEETDQTKLQVESGGDPAIRSRMSGVERLRTYPIPGGRFLDAQGKAVAKLPPAAARGPAAGIVRQTIRQLSYVFGSAAAQESGFEVMRDPGFAPRILAGCPRDPEARAKVLACVEADREVRRIQWRQVIEGAIFNQGGSITVDRDGNVQQFFGNVLEPSEAPDFSIREDQAKAIAIEHVRAERMISDLEGIARATEGTGRFYSFDDDENVIAYWEFEVVITPPGSVRRQNHYVRVDAATGKAHSVDFLEYAGGGTVNLRSRSLQGRY